MSPAVPLVQNISDTACWAAVYRARENERPDALFRDRLARRLAGQRGEAIAAGIGFSDRHAWSWIARTWLFDQFIVQKLQQGVDLVVNLAAGLDARPYRMPLPASLKWVEVDLPGLVAYKQEVIGSERTACTVERYGLDLSDLSARRELFARLGQGAGQALAISEGLLIYLSADEVAALARDLEAVPAFRWWIVDLASPGLLAMLKKNMESKLKEGGAALKFGPQEGPEFFARFGWKPIAVRSLLKTAAGLKRLPWLMRLLALLPQSNGRQGSRPWGGVCLLEKQAAPID
jgi:methyltransferase (TIGR00027 family)